VVIAVGSHSRKAGKTSLVCALIRAFPEARWTAVKISGHEHGAGEAYTLTEESDAAGPHDTSRYLRAGAARSYLLRSTPGRLAEAIPALRAVLEAGENTILESSRVVEFIQPDLFLFVLHESAPQFKETARAYLPRADRVVVISETEQMPPEVVELVRERLCRRKRNR
jgi:hypothetical protein